MKVINPKGTIKEIPDHMWPGLEKKGFKKADQSLARHDAMSKGQSARRTNAPVLSIIVLAWNRWDLTRKCLESIFENTRVPYELIVVDNASTDSTRRELEAIQEQRNDVRLIFNETNRGVAGGRNDGILAAKGQFLAFFDNDSVVGAGWDEIMLGVFERNHRAGFVGRNGTIMHDFTQKGMRCITLETADEMRCDLVSGGATMIRKEVFQDVGLLDEWGMGEFWHEDAEICLRAARAGWESYAVKYEWHHEAHSSYKMERGEEWMVKFQANLDYIRDKMKRDNEIRIYINNDSYEPDMVDYGRRLAAHATCKGFVCIKQDIPPIIPSSVRRAVSFMIEHKGRRYWYVSPRNTVSPAQWKGFFASEADEVIVPSGFSAAALGKSKSIGIDDVFPDANVFNGQARATRLLGQDAFVFMHHGSTKQQGTDAVIDAYFEEFTREDNVMLVIKTWELVDEDILKRIETLKEAGKVQAPYVVYTGPWTDKKLASYLARVAKHGAFVFPARAASDALIPRMAKACHAPLIAFKHGALSDLVIDGEVKFEMEPSSYMNNVVEPFYTNGESPEWAEPDVDDLRKVMRKSVLSIKNSEPFMRSQQEQFDSLLESITA